MSDSKVSSSTAGASTTGTKEMRPAKRSMSALQLGFLLFFLTAGGPFGIEPAVQAGGALVVIVGSLVTAFFWAFPQAILATELGLMMDSNGGGFLWVHRAWGPFIGWLNGWNAMASSFINLGLLVLLFPGYLSVATTPWVPNAWQVSEWEG
jgi:amino acid transporter